MTSHKFSNEFGALQRPARNADHLDTAAQTIRGILQLAIVGLLMGVLLQDVKLPLSLIGVCVLLLLWLILRTNATPLLVTTQLILFFREPSRPGTENAFGSIVYVAVVLGLLMFLSRDQLLKRLIRQAVKDLVKSLIGKTDKVPETLTTQATRPPALPSSSQASSHVRQIAWLLVCVLVSQLLLISFGTTGGVEEGRQPAPRAEQLLQPVPRLLIIILVVVIVTSELAWRRLTIRQASMYFRSTQALWLHADIRLIFKRRLRGCPKRGLSENEKGSGTNGTADCRL